MSIAAPNATAFVEEALECGAVWGIRDSDGFPTSTNASGETTMPFWSQESRAQLIIDNVPAYGGFTPCRLELAVFLERWLPGLEGDGLFVGLNWSGARATGYDLSPSQVIARFKAART